MKTTKLQTSQAQVTSEILGEIEGEVLRMMGTLQKLKTRVAHDDLTGLLRRDEFFHRLQGLMSAGQGGEVTLVLIDIDDFKRINDTDGHVVGDHVLQRVAAVLKRCERIGAEIGRFGGEEFILAIGAPQEAARALAEAIRRQIQREVNVTVSVGLSTATSANWEVRRMVGSADEALYEAKRTGKNRVCLAA